MSAEADPYLTILIPAYNDEASLLATIPIVMENMDQLSCSYEILVINDGSTDSTVRAVQGLMLQSKAIRLYSHRKNLGPGSGIYTGLAVARGEFVLFLPADLAMEPLELPRLVQACSDADVVVGIRSDRSDYSVGRKAVSLANIVLIKLLFGMRLRQYNYIQAYRRAIFDGFYPQRMGAFITAEILIRARDAGCQLVEVALTYRPRSTGRTHVGKPKVVWHTVCEMFSFWYRWVLQSSSVAPHGCSEVQAFVRREVLPLLTEEPTPCGTT